MIYYLYRHDYNYHIKEGNCLKKKLIIMEHPKGFTIFWKLMILFNIDK